MEQIDTASLPQNLEAEQALLGAVLANNKAYEKVSEFLRPYHFADSIHAKIFEVISKLIQRGHVADVITLKNYFEQEGSLNEVGGHQYLIKLADSASPLTNVEYYAQFIYDKYLRRELINTGYEIVSDAMKEDLDTDATAQIETAEKKLFELSNQGESQGGFIDFAEALTSSLGQIEQAYQKDGKISGLPSGLDALDEKTGGLNNSDLIIIAGRPAMGKTALATNIAYNVAEFMSHDKSVDPKSRGVAFFSLEMSADQLAGRILSTVTQTPGHKMRGRTLDNAFVILDEAQNTTLSQIKMFLTRMGRNARFIVTGDVTQVDLPRKSDSGLVRAMELLRGVDGIGIVEFDRRDIVRHPLVKHIVEAFEHAADGTPAPEHETSNHKKE